MITKFAFALFGENLYKPYTSTTWILNSAEQIVSIDGTPKKLIQCNRVPSEILGMFGSNNQESVLFFSGDDLQIQGGMRAPVIYLCDASQQTECDMMQHKLMEYAYPFNQLRENCEELSTNDNYHKWTEEGTDFLYPCNY